MLCTIHVISLASPGSTVSVPFEHKENEIGNSSESSMNEMNRMQAAKPNFQPFGYNQQQGEILKSLKKKSFLPLVETK
jgi:hypothetical protein